RGEHEGQRDGEEREPAPLRPDAEDEPAREHGKEEQPVAHDHVGDELPEHDLERGGGQREHLLVGAHLTLADQGARGDRQAEVREQHARERGQEEDAVAERRVEPEALPDVDRPRQARRDVPRARGDEARRARASALRSSTAHGTLAGLLESTRPKMTSIMIGCMRTTPRKAWSWRTTRASRYATASTFDQKRRLTCALRSCAARAPRTPRPRARAPRAP